MDRMILNNLNAKKFRKFLEERSLLERKRYLTDLRLLPMIATHCVL